MVEISSAVILAAGHGKRLKPFTDFLPKPAMPIANIPSIVKIIEELANFNLTSFYVNTHHLPDVVKKLLQSGNDKTISIVHEPLIRGTGGGIENFRRALQNQPFLLYNADVYSEQNLQDLQDFHLSASSLVTLMAVDVPEFNSLVVKGNHLSDVSRKNGSLTYSGIAVFSPEVWKYFPHDLNFSLVDVFRSVMSNNLPIGVFKSTAYWNDFGTVERYFQLHAKLARCNPQNIHVQASVKDCELRGFCFVGEGCDMRDCLIEDSIVLPGTKMVGKLIRYSVVLGEIIIPVKR